jgi:hypothetical protein
VEKNNLSWEDIGLSADAQASQNAPATAGRDQCGLEHLPTLAFWPLDGLRPHPSYVRHGLSPSVAQLSALSALGENAFREPIVITSDGLIVDGYARFELAKRQGRRSVLCLEYLWSEEDALRWLIQRHRPTRGVGAYNRALLAFDLEPSLLETARANQRWGGQNKGSSGLTEAQIVNVRSKISADAAISSGTLDKVRKVKSAADLKVREATRAEEISIHKASRWCSLPAHKQLEELEKHRSRKGIDQTSRRLIQKHVATLMPTQLVPANLGDFLKAFISHRSLILDLIVVAEIDAPGNIAYFTKDALRNLRSISGQKGNARPDEENSVVPGCLGST